MRFVIWNLLLCTSLPLCLQQYVYADFEDLGMGARAQGMGNAFVAVADDSKAVYFNPAGLAWVRQSELSIDYYRLYAGLEDDSVLDQSFVSYVYPFSFRKINVVRPEATPPNQPVQGGENIPVISTYTVSGSSEPILNLRSLAISLPEKQMTQMITQNLNTFGVSYRGFRLANHYKEDTFYLTYARRLLKSMAMGTNLKFLREAYVQDDYTRIDPVFNYGRVSGVSAISADIGVLYGLMPRVYAGFCIKDINRPDVGIKSKNRLPAEYSLGIGYRQRIAEAGLDAVYKGGRYSLRSGLERWFGRRNYALRGGIGFEPGGAINLSMGCGLALSGMQMDYGFLFPVSGIEGTAGSHRISFTYRFGLPPGDELEPGSLELSYIKMVDERNKLRGQLEETQEQKSKLEQVLIEEATRRIKEKIETVKTYAMPARVSSGKTQAVKERTKVIEQLTVKTHYVAAGDTLQSLAIKYYNNPKKWMDIYNNNRDKVRRGGALHPGDVLLVPDVLERKVIRLADSPREEVPEKETESDTESADVDVSTPAVSVVPGSGQAQITPPAPEAVPSSAASVVPKPVLVKQAQPAPKPKVRYHKVVEGDTLRLLAERYYHDPKRWKDIYNANPGKFMRDEPRQGETLVIP